MPKAIDKLKYIKVKEAKLKGLGNSKALLYAGYTKSTAEHHNSDMTVVKRVEAEILAEFKASMVTVETVLAEIELVRKLAIESNDLSTAGRMAELKGKWLAMFTDKQQVDAKIMTQEDRSIIDKYTHSNRLPIGTG